MGQDFADRYWTAPGPGALRLHARDYPAASGEARYFRSSAKEPVIVRPSAFHRA